MDGRRTKLREGVQEIGPFLLRSCRFFSGGRGLGEALAVPYGRLGGLVVLVGVLRRGEEARCGAAAPSSQG